MQRLIPGDRIVETEFGNQPNILLLYNHFTFFQQDYILTKQ